MRTSGCDAGVGKYDRLYCAAGLLWPAIPGRMVVRAAAAMAPGRALDLGCGDGKNLVYLRSLGWWVDGVDVSALAIEAAERRIAASGVPGSGFLHRADVTAVDVELNAYDLVIAYGLYHCLSDEELVKAHGRAANALRRDGLFVFATFNDELQVPPNHETGCLYLRPTWHMGGLLAGWHERDHEHGRIEELHPPLVGMHQRSVTWGVFAKP